MKSQIEVSDDERAQAAFVLRYPEPLTLPPVLLAEYARRGEPVALDGPAEHPLLAQYQNAEGYCFSWGHILEHYAIENSGFVLWRFCPLAALEQLHAAGRGLGDLQRAALGILKRRTPYVNEDPLTVVELSQFALYPGSTVDAFALVAHFIHEHAAREWAKEWLIPGLPVLWDEAKKEVLSKA